MDTNIAEKVERYNEIGQVVRVTLRWRGKIYYLQMFFPGSKFPSRGEVETQVKKIYPDAVVMVHYASETQPNQPLIRVTEERDEYGDPVGGPKISKKEKEKNLKKNTPDEQHTTTTSEGYGSDRVGPALKVARVIDRVNPRPKPNSKRTRVSRALKLASIKKDEKIRKRQENPYSADKRLKMVATSIRDRVKQKAKAMTTREDYIPEEGYDIARDMGKVKPSKDKKDGTTMPPSPEMKKTQKVNKGPSAFDRVKKKYGKAVMVVGKK